MTEMLYKYQYVLYYYIILLQYLWYYKGFVDVYHSSTTVFLS